MKIKRFYTNGIPLRPFPFGGPTRLARFEPSPDPHGAYDEQADNVGEDYLADRLTQKYNAQGWSFLESQNMAQTDAKRIRVKRDALNQEFYYNRELNRLDSEIEYSLKLDERDGKYHLWSDDFEEFLPEMLDNWERYLTEEKHQPELFNKEEARAIKDMDQKFASGEAVSAFYAVSEPYVADTIRYVNQFVYQNGKVVAQYLDVGKFVRDLHIDEAADVINTLGKRFGFDILGNGSGFQYMVSGDTILTAAQIHTAVLEKLALRDGQTSVDAAVDRWKNNIRSSPITETRDTVSDSFIQAGRDVRATLAPIGVHLWAEFYHKKKKQAEEEEKKKSLQKPEQRPSVIDKVKQFIKENVVKEKNKPVQTESPLKTIIPVVLFEETHASQSNKNTKQERRVYRAANHSERVLARWILPVAGEFKLSSLLVMVLAKGEQKGKLNKKSVRRAEHAQTRIHNLKQEDAVVHKDRKHKKRKKYNVLALGKHEAGISMKKRTLKSTKEATGRGEHSGHLDKIVAVAATEKKLFTAARRLMRSIRLENPKRHRRRNSTNKNEQNKHTEKRILQRNNESGKVTRESIQWFTMGLIVWLLVRGSEKRQKVDVVQNSHFSRDNFLNKLESKKQKAGDAKKLSQEKNVLPLENSPWVLLSIIWYMTMIRESGLSAHSKQKYKAKKKRLKKFSVKKNRIVWLPERGVIYTANP